MWLFKCVDVYECSVRNSEKHGCSVRWNDTGRPVAPFHNGQVEYVGSGHTGGPAPSPSNQRWPANDATGFRHFYGRRLASADRLKEDQREVRVVPRANGGPGLSKLTAQAAIAG